MDGSVSLSGYFKLNGRDTVQTAIFGTGAAAVGVLQATSHATPGSISIKQDATTEIARFVGAAATDDRYLAIGGTSRILGYSKLHVEDSTTHCYIEGQCKAGANWAGIYFLNATSDVLQAVVTGSASQGLQSRSVLYIGTPGPAGQFGIGPTNSAELFHVQNGAPVSACSGGQWSFGLGTGSSAIVGPVTGFSSTAGGVVGYATNQGQSSWARFEARMGDSTHRLLGYVTSTALSPDWNLVTPNDAVIEADAALDLLLIQHKGAKPIRFAHNNAFTYTMASGGNLTMDTDSDFTPATDSQGEIGTATLRWGKHVANDFSVYAIAAHANPTVKVTSNSLEFGAGDATAVDVKLSRAEADVLALASGDSLKIVQGYVEGAEMTPPAAPAANGYRLYSDDSGGGKTRLMVLFASGVAQQIAIEP